ncbi:hypothetical protein D3C83_46530 [compost metagenome]
MAHERDVCLVMDDPGEHIVGMNRHGEPFALPQRGARFVRTARLRQEHGREGMHEREMPPVARRMQRRGGFRQMLAHDSRIADLLVAEGQLVMREPDGA